MLVSRHQEGNRVNKDSKPSEGVHMFSLAEEPAALRLRSEVSYIPVNVEPH